MPGGVPVTVSSLGGESGRLEGLPVAGLRSSGSGGATGWSTLSAGGAVSSLSQVLLGVLLDFKVLGRVLWIMGVGPGHGARF
jgi:hypothetical protein